MQRMVFQSGSYPAAPEFRALADDGIGARAITELSKDAGAGAGHARRGKTRQPVEIFRNDREAGQRHRLQIIAPHAGFPVGGVHGGAIALEFGCAKDGDGRHLYRRFENDGSFAYDLDRARLRASWDFTSLLGIAAEWNLDDYAERDRAWGTGADFKANRYGLYLRIHK